MPKLKFYTNGLDFVNYYIKHLIMETSELKKNLMSWLETVDSEKILLQIDSIRRQNDENFDNAMKNGYTSKQFIAVMNKRIDSYDLRK